MSCGPSIITQNLPERKQIITLSKKGFCYLVPLRRSSPSGLGILSALRSEWELLALCVPPVPCLPLRHRPRLPIRDHPARPHLASKSPWSESEREEQRPRRAVRPSVRPSPFLTVVGPEECEIHLQTCLREATRDIHNQHCIATWSISRSFPEIWQHSWGREASDVGGGGAHSSLRPSVPRTRISERDYSLRIAARRRCRRRGRESE